MRTFSQKQSPLDALSPDIYFVPPAYSAYESSKNRLYKAATGDTSLNAPTGIPKKTHGLVIPDRSNYVQSGKAGWDTFQRQYQWKLDFAEPVSLVNDYDPKNFYHV